MDFIQIENKNHYQLKKIIDFLHHFQNNIPSLTIFYDHYFRSAAMIPFVDIRKVCTSSYSRTDIYIFFYTWPFSFPFSFLSYQANYEL